MTVERPSVNRTCPKSYLTLSAVGQDGQEPDGSLTAPAWDSTPFVRPPSADDQTYVPDERVPPVDDALLRELLPTILDQYPPLTEAELRAMWGDR